MKPSIATHRTPRPACRRFQSRLGPTGPCNYTSKERDASPHSAGVSFTVTLRSHGCQIAAIPGRIGEGVERIFAPGAGRRPRVSNAIDTKTPPRQHPIRTAFLRCKSEEDLSFRSSIRQTCQANTRQSTASTFSYHLSRASAVTFIPAPPVRPASLDATRFSTPLRPGRSQS